MFFDMEQPAPHKLLRNDPRTVTNSSRLRSGFQIPQIWVWSSFLGQVWSMEAHGSHLALSDQGMDTTPRGFPCDVWRLWVLCDVRRGLHDQSCSSKAPGSFWDSSDRSWAALPVQQGALRPSSHYFHWVFISWIGKPFFPFRCAPLAVMSECEDNTDAIKKKKKKKRFSGILLLRAFMWIFNSTWTHS